MSTSNTYDSSADTGGSPLGLELPLSVGGGGVEIELRKSWTGNNQTWAICRCTEELL
jgi:hypothetical protein